MDGRDYRLHRECGEFVWLAALDAGIAGPFYWVRAETLRPNPSQSEALSGSPVETDRRAERLKAAQSRLKAIAGDEALLNGPEYMAALLAMSAIVKDGRG